MRDNADADQPQDGFLVDGVAPAVIGGDEIEQHDPNPTPPGIPAVDREPPTAPIPVLGNDQRSERRSWISKLFRSG